MAFKAVFLAHAPDAEPTKHRCMIETSKYQLFSVVVKDQVQALWYNLPHMAEVTHTIHSVSNQPSYLLLPVIPKGHTGAGEPAYPPAGPFRIPKYMREV